MSESWVKQRKQILDNIQTMNKAEEKDRLDYVKSIKTLLVYMGQSLAVWGKLINNSQFMAVFNKNELGEIASNFSDLTKELVNSDIKTIRTAREKGVQFKLFKLKDSKEKKFIV
jgi:hypothetical protein